MSIILSFMTISVALVKKGLVPYRVEHQPSSKEMVPLAVESTRTVEFTGRDSRQCSSEREELKFATLLAKAR